MRDCRCVSSLSWLGFPTPTCRREIERGLKKPSAEILQQLAKGPRSRRSRCMSGRALDPHRQPVLKPGHPQVIAGDPRLTSRQKDSLLAVYDSCGLANRGSE